MIKKVDKGCAIVRMRRCDGGAVGVLWLMVAAPASAAQVVLSLSKQTWTERRNLLKY